MGAAGIRAGGWRARANARAIHFSFWLAQANANLVPHKPGNWILPTYGNTDCWKDYEPGVILGKGTFGTTYLAIKKGTNQKFAVKASGLFLALFLSQSWSQLPKGQR